MSKNINLVKIDNALIGRVSNIKITNICDLNNKSVYVVGKETDLPVLKYGLDNNDCIVIGPEKLKNFAKTDIHFMSQIDKHLIIIPQNKFELVYAEPNTISYNLIKDDLKQKVVQSIISSNLSKVCKNPDCFMLKAFFKQNNKLNLIVQELCRHVKSINRMYIVNCDFDVKLMKLSNYICLRVYDIFNLGLSENIEKDKLESMHIQSATVKDNKLIILTSYGRSGYLWNIDYYNVLGFYGTNMQLLYPNGLENGKIINKPRGIVCLEDKSILVITNTIEKNLKDDAYYVKYYIFR